MVVERQRCQPSVVSGGQFAGDVLVLADRGSVPVEPLKLCVGPFEELVVLLLDHL